MRKPSIALTTSLVAAALFLSVPYLASAQSRDKFIISAKAGGVNAVTGRALVRGRGTSEWQQLTITDDLERGDVVKTGQDGRVEILLNPGSYMRLAENSEFELSNNSLENLEVRLTRGTAIMEVTGADDAELLINVITPHTRMAIVRRGLYRVNVMPEDATELIVRKGRVMLEGSHTKINGGDKVVFSGGSSFSVAKLNKDEKKKLDSFDLWSKERAETVAMANRRLRPRDMSLMMASFNDSWSRFSWGRSYRSGGMWVYNPKNGCYTFMPFYGGWGSPYGSSYSSAFYGGYYGGTRCCGGYPTGGTTAGSPTGGTTIGASPGGVPSSAPITPSRSSENHPGKSGGEAFRDRMP